MSEFHVQLGEFGTDGPPLNWGTTVRDTRFKSLRLQHQNWSGAVEPGAPTARAAQCWGTRQTEKGFVFIACRRAATTG